MLLGKLRELAARGADDYAPPMYARTPIRWFVDLDDEGRLLGFVDLSEDGKRGRRLPAPHAQRSSGIRAKLLADNGEYVLGLAREASKPERVAACHQAFRDLVDRCAEETGEPSIRAVERFLKSLDRDALALPEDLAAADNLTFRVGETIPIDLPSVRRWWAEASAPSGESEGPAIECLVCGETKAVERRQQFKIKGIPGGQPSGMSLVSANARAFESYGLEESFVSPICRDCGEAFAKAANGLLRDRESHLVVGSTVFVFWTREDVGFSPFTVLSDPTPGDVKTLLDSARRGRPEAEADFDDTPFYAAALTASGGRVVVRDWIDSTVPRVRENLRRHFRAQALLDPENPEEPRWYSLYTLSRATVREMKDLRDETPRALAAFALAGTPLPERLLYEAVRRSRADQQLTRPRAALLKMVLASQDPRLEETMERLDPKGKTPAYHCGRLLAVLEQVQKEAIPGAKATLVDRFFGSASSAPASVFGTLLRGAQPHLAKLRKDEKKQAAFRALDKRLAEIMAHLDEFPRTLSLRDQAMFSLGYYHQQAQRRADIAASRKAKEAASSAEADET